MIKKLDPRLFSEAQHCILSDKINEIIDHLPQEKEYCTCKFDKMGQLPCSVNGFCGKCGKKIDLNFNEPTKEVPDIRRFIDNLLSNYLSIWNDDNLMGKDWAKAKENFIDRAIQEISALYRKENV